MVGSNDYRFVRSFGENANLHAVTFRGIDDFLASDDAGDAGLVMMLHGPAGQESGGLHGGPDIGAILREMKGLPFDMQETARPLAVVTLTTEGSLGQVCEQIAKRLMGRVDGVSAESHDHLGAYEFLVDVVARAIPHVLGVNPFLSSGTLN